jgi:hypothetical protein
MNYEDGLRAMGALVEWYKGNAGTRNEATTRLRLIDVLFFECLGWSKDDAVAEEAQGKEFSDYTFHAPRRILIVEAKREGDYFELPAGKARPEMAIPALMRTYSNVAKALDQASGYCQKRGVPFGVVTNGHQLIAFVANRNDGIAPLEGRALVFDSLEQMENNFLDLWNVLSKSGIEEKALLYRLIPGVPLLPQKLSATIKPYPGVIERNVVQSDLQILGDLILEDVIPSPDLEQIFLQECYAQSGALSQYSLASRQILEARYSNMFSSNDPSPSTLPAVAKGGLSSELLSVSVARRPILLLGDVGVGKTTFLRNLIKVEAAGFFERAIALHLNLGTQGALATDLRVYVLDEIDRQLREEFKIDVYESAFVRGTYSQDLKRFEKSIYGELKYSNPPEYARRELDELSRLTSNKGEHLRRALENVTQARQRQVVIFLDNADQRDEPTQESAFLIAHEIAQQWQALVFIALRPETFNRSQRVGALTGYHAKAFTISPPRIDQVILKRLGFALRITLGEIPIAKLQNVGVKLENLTTIIRILLYSLRLDAQLFEFIDNISGGNVRAALELLITFIGSGHVNTRKMLDSYARRGRYQIPPHEMVRAVIYGDSANYDPGRSVITNMFDISSRDKREHFLLALVIGVLDHSSSQLSTEGFVRTDFLYDSLQQMGFMPDQIDFAVSRGIDRRLIETSGRQILVRGDDLPASLRATPNGLYHAYRLTALFQYLDAMLIDTPILDDGVREKLGSANVADNIADRLSRAEIFADYLDAAWKPLASQAVGFDWADSFELFQQQVVEIRWREARRKLRY